MNPKVKKTIIIILPILLGVFLVWYSLSKVPLYKILESWQEADKNWVLLGVFLGLLSHLSRAYRWLFMLEPLGYEIKFPNSIMAVFATYLINYTIPRAGEVARASILANYEGVPFEKGFGTIVAERIADLLVMLLIIGIALVLQFEFIYQFFAERFNLKDVIVIFGGLIAVLVAVYLFISKSSSKIGLKVKNFISGLLEGAKSILKMEKKWAFIFHTFFIWIMYVSMFYVTSLAFPDLEGIAFGAILIAFISASFSIAATNGGIGAYPAAIYGAFSIFGISKVISLSFGWIMWASQTLMIIVFGGISLIYLPIYNRNRKKSSE